MQVHQTCLQLIFITVLFASTTTLAQNFMPEDDWVCGATANDQALAYQSANESCFDVGTLVNQCCMVHDDCYVNHGNQSECDVPFCACLAVQAGKSRNKHCRGTLEVFCYMVQLFGGLAHASSRKDKVKLQVAENGTVDVDGVLTDLNLITTSTEMMTTSTTIPTTTTLIIAPFHLEECFDDYKMELCAGDFEYCGMVGEEPGHVCQEKMCQCTEEALRSSKSECRNSVDRVCREASKYKQSKRAATFDYLFQEVNYFGYTVTILTACLASVLIGGFIVIIISVVYRYMTRTRSFSVSPSRTPLCAATSADLSLGYFQNSNNPLIEEKKHRSHYP